MHFKTNNVHEDNINRVSALCKIAFSNRTIGYIIEFDCGKNITMIINPFIILAKYMYTYEKEGIGLYLFDYFWFKI